MSSSSITNYPWLELYWPTGRLNGLLANDTAITICQNPVLIGGRTGLDCFANDLTIHIRHLDGELPTISPDSSIESSIQARLHLGSGLLVDCLCQVLAVSTDQTTTRLKINLRDAASARYEAIKGLTLFEIATRFGTSAAWSVPYRGMKSGTHTAGWYAGQPDQLVQFPLQGFETFGTTPLNRYLVTLSGFAERLPAFSLLRLLDKLATDVGMPLTPDWQNQPHLQDAMLISDQPDLAGWNWGQLGQASSTQTDATSIVLTQDLELVTIVPQTGNIPDRLDYQVPITADYEVAASITVTNTHPTDVLLGLLGSYALYDGYGWNVAEAQEPINLAPGATATYSIADTWSLDNGLKVLFAVSLSHDQSTWTYATSITPQWATELDLRPFLPNLTFEELVSQTAALCLAQYQPRAKSIGRQDPHLALCPIELPDANHAHTIHLTGATLWQTSEPQRMTTALLRNATDPASGLLASPVPAIAPQVSASTTIAVFVEGTGLSRFRVSVASNNQTPLGARTYLVKWMGYLNLPGTTTPALILHRDGRGTTGYVTPFPLTDWAELPHWLNHRSNSYQVLDLPHPKMDEMTLLPALVCFIGQQVEVVKVAHQQYLAAGLSFELSFDSDGIVVTKSTATLLQLVDW